MSEKALQLAEEREAESKGERERYTPLNAEFQIISRKDRKVLQCNQCKELRKTIEWGRLEISSRKLDTKGTFHAKVGIIKDKKGMDLIEAEDIKKR